MRRHRAGILAAAALWAAIVGGCSERDRSNPLDPANLDEGGPLAEFNAIAGDGQVELRWNRLTQTGVLGYRLQRWRRGELPAFVGDLYPQNYAGALDTSAMNGEEYVYRLVAYLTTGDSVTSPADTAIAGARHIAVLTSTLPGILGLSPDGRDLIYAVQSDDAYEDIEADDRAGVLWLSTSLLDRVDRLTWTGAFAGPIIRVSSPSDVAIDTARSVGWIASPSEGRILSYSVSSSVISIINTPQEPRVVEVGSADGTVWVGSRQGTVYRYSSQGIDSLLDAWPVGGQVIAMALDGRGSRAFVATRSRLDGTADSLRIVDVLDSTVTTQPYALTNLADLAFDPATHQLWISERGAPRQGEGRLSRASQDGSLLQSWAPLEPFGIDLDAGGTCWVADLRSQRVLAITAGGVIALWTPRMEAPYQVRVGDPVP